MALVTLRILIKCSTLKANLHAALRAQAHFETCDKSVPHRKICIYGYIHTHQHTKPVGSSRSCNQGKEKTKYSPS